MRISDWSSDVCSSDLVRVSPGELGRATVHDRDVLIYCISQLMAALNSGQPVNKVVRFKAYDLLVATNRGTDGRGYEQLRSAFKRLQGTQIETNILTGGTEALDIFSLIDRVRIMRETREGRMQEDEENGRTHDGTYILNAKHESCCLR